MTAVDLGEPKTVSNTEADCLRQRLLAITVRPFVGDPVSVKKVLSLPPAAAPPPASSIGVNPP
ncbi:MAG: hypothetical protein JW751_11305 [Polyangiaceae bacterium]|nr:hypothetical protein [Polyangiaceae bacterium]